jgi:hypothetical protein
MIITEVIYIVFERYRDDISSGADLGWLIVLASFIILAIAEGFGVGSNTLRQVITNRPNGPIRYSPFLFL